MTDVVAMPSMTDPPFACPLEVVVDLPYPPSVNRLWRATSEHGESSVYLSPAYKKWKREADALLMMTRGWRAGKILGAFTTEINLCPPKGQTRGDIDNFAKAVLDFLQRVEIIINDKHCERLVMQWVDQARAPNGCRVTVRPCA